MQQEAPITTAEAEEADAAAEVVESEAASLMARLKAEVASSPNPEPLSVQLPLDEITLLPELFQPRGVSEQHVSELMRKPKSGHTLDPLTVFQVGRKAYLIDGHHRIAAYQRAKFEKPVPVVFFDGTVEQAVLEAGRANSKAKLSMSTQERMNFAWRLVRIGTYSKTEITEAASVSDGQVAAMRRVLKALGDEAHDFDSWMKAKRQAEGKGNLEFSDEDIATWKEAAAQSMADRLAKALSTRMADRPEIAARALSIYFGRRLPELYRELGSYVSDVDLEDDEESDF
ncbi:ParB domain protein nuclease [uncultured Alphaproteobacteria bacterium]|uniref:ParB domain protein nuclease n=1 Tax=uncultured Alphaproteobacteria bacterium TaxID=91750 RepID=A0A212JIJ6_9PROT|nr:ParB domain protein nuclease [uncultured Alphaproteobacteria bacterium]